jgi:hypothetical protein
LEEIDAIFGEKAPSTSNTAGEERIGMENVGVGQENQQVLQEPGSKKE